MSIQMNPSDKNYCSNNVVDEVPKVSSGPIKITLLFPKISKKFSLISEAGKKMIHDPASSIQAEDKAILGKRKFESIEDSDETSHKKRKISDSSSYSIEDTLSNSSSSSFEEEVSESKVKKTAQVINKLNKGPWLVDELTRLNEAMEKVEDSTKDYWNTIAESVMTRTSKQCRNKYYEMSKEKWSPREIAALKQGYQKHRDNWSKIAETLKNRTESECKRKASTLNLSGSKEWTTEERDLLIKLAQSYVNAKRNINWNKISEKIPSKTANQCRASWLVLDPSLSKEPWTAEEDAKLLSILDKYRITYKGQPSIAWKELAKELPGRSGVACAKRYNRHLSEQ